MQVNIRIRDDLYEKLREEAKNWHRTITAQLETILLEALGEQETNNRNTIEKNVRTSTNVSNKLHRKNTIGEEETDTLWN